MAAIPAAIIFVNNDLSESVRAMLIRQLHIDEVITGADFDARVSADSNYPNNYKLVNSRLMVVRSFEELQNREYADVVMFIKHGRAAIEESKFGPPGMSYPVVNLTWGKLNIF